jgi:hypothetical protein
VIAGVGDCRPTCCYTFAFEEFNYPHARDERNTASFAKLLFTRT